MCGNIFKQSTAVPFDQSQCSFGTSFWCQNLQNAVRCGQQVSHLAQATTLIIEHATSTLRSTFLLFRQIFIEWNLIINRFGNEGIVFVYVILILITQFNETEDTHEL